MLLSPLPIARPPTARQPVVDCFDRNTYQSGKGQRAEGTRSRRSNRGGEEYKETVLGMCVCVCLGPLIVKEINIILKSMLLDDNVTYLATLSIPL